MKNKLAYQNLLVAASEYDKAEEAVKRFKETYYLGWQIDEPMTAEERRADDQIREAAREVENVHKQCLRRLIEAVRGFVS